MPLILNSMTVRLVFGGLLLAMMPAAWAVSCRVQCLDSSCKVERDSKTTDVSAARSTELLPCEGHSGKEGRMGLWYIRDNLVVAKILNMGSLTTPLIADATSSCTESMAKCLTAVQRTKVPGISPMGQAQEGPQGSGAGVGLPFDDVWQPETGMQWQAWAPANGDGELTVIDLSTQSPIAKVAVRAGRAQLPPNALREGQRYQYHWVTAAGTVNGSFTAARAGTVQRAERAVAAALADEAVQPKVPEMIRVQKWAAAGLRWDAQRLLEQKSEENPR